MSSFFARKADSLPMIGFQNNTKMAEPLTSRGRVLLFFAFISVMASVAVAQSGGSRVGQNRGYATDQFEGFEAYDLDERVPQKEWSMWYSLHRDTPAEQLAFAYQERKEGNLNHARKCLEALVREWPTAKEAAEAQLEIARLQEARNKCDQAFEEYQYLLIHYAGHCPYEKILETQYKLANLLLHDNRSMFGWLLSGNDAVRERFEVIVRNAPRSDLAPECMLIIAGLRVSDDELDEAVKVYDGLLNRYPTSKQAPDAAYLAAKCRYDLAKRSQSNEARCRDAVAFLRAIRTRMPGHPRREELNAWYTEMTDLLIDQNYRNARFYDTKQRNVAAAKAAYRRFLSEFGSSKYAEEVRQRLAVLEAAQK